MTKTDPPPKQAVTLDVAAMKGALKPIGGSESDDWNDVIASQASNSIWKSSNPEVADSQLNAVVAGLYFISPKDELEGMLAAQLMASHNAAMECYRRAMIPEQPFVGRSEALTQANKLSRTYAGLLDALNRHRGKGQQKVTVEHVHVYDGGQAIVGAVGGGGGPDKMEHQPHAIRHAERAPLRCQDSEREAVPVPRDAERPLLDARRPLHRGTQGKSKRVYARVLLDGCEDAPTRSFSAAIGRARSDLQRTVDE